MGTTFLSGQIARQLRQQTSKSTKKDIAVAFWGDGAIERIGLRKASSARVVCNLRMGGTNPTVIKELMTLGFEVRHNDALHAKLYIFDDVIVVSSSNASANGLSIEGTDATGWIEASAVVEDEEARKDAEALFHRIWKSSSVVTDKDLELAEDAWSRRRHNTIVIPHQGASNLLDLLRHRPETVSGQRIFLVVDDGEFSAEAERKLANIQDQTGLGDELDAWEDWFEMPDDAFFVCFWRGPKGGVTFTGFFESPSTRWEEKLSNRTSLQLVMKRQTLKGIRSAGPLAEWREPIQRLLEDRGASSTTLELGPFGRKYLGGS